MIRELKKKYPSRPSSDGTGVKLNRVFSRRDVKEVDPFLLLDFFDSRNPDDYTKGFPWHPHRGALAYRMGLRHRASPSRSRDRSGDPGRTGGSCRNRRQRERC